MKKIIKKVMLLGTDISLAAVLVSGVYVGNYLIPQKGIKTATVSAMHTDTPMVPVMENWDANLSTLKQTTLPEQQSLISQNGLKFTSVIKDSTDWHKKFADHFTSSVVSTDTSYTSPNISIQIKKKEYDSGVLDYSAKGKHLRYGTNIAYIMADIYVGDISCLQTAFAQDTYGIGYSEKLSDMSSVIGSVLAVNGDSYNNNLQQENGTIIRNGIIYRNQQTNMETCVLNWDGTMQIYAPGQLDTQALINNGAYQSWLFGPSLLDENGKAKKVFLTEDYIKQSHPRTAIGYFEPGHYCLLVVDGRQNDYSRGMFLQEEAAIFEQLGCKVAYNLDGGHCSFMTMYDQVISHPYKPKHKVPDGIFIMEQEV